MRAADAVGAVAVVDDRAVGHLAVAPNDLGGEVAGLAVGVGVGERGDGVEAALAGAQGVEVGAGRGDGRVADADVDRLDVKGVAAAAARGAVALADADQQLDLAGEVLGGRERDGLRRLVNVHRADRRLIHAVGRDDGGVVDQAVVLEVGRGHREGEGRVGGRDEGVVEVEQDRRAVAEVGHARDGDVPRARLAVAVGGGDGDADVGAGGAGIGDDAQDAVGDVLDRADRVDHDRRGGRAVAGVGAAHGLVGDVVLHGKAANELAEDGEVEVEGAGRAVGDEQLAAGGVLAAVGGGELAVAGEQGVQVELVVEHELGADDVVVGAEDAVGPGLAVGAVVERAAELEDAVGRRHAADLQPVVEAGVGQRGDAADGVGRDVVEELEEHHAKALDVHLQERAALDELDGGVVVGAGGEGHAVAVGVAGVDRQEQGVGLRGVDGDGQLGDLRRRQQAARLERVDRQADVAAGVAEGAAGERAG